MKERVKSLGLALFLFATMLLSACASPREKAQDLAARHGWRGEVVRAGLLDLQSFLPSRFQAGAPLVVYIEGDGMARLSRFQLSADPTPWGEPMGLRLAVADGRANTVYLARPCQYVSGSNRRNCQPAFWDTAAYAPEVIGAYMEAIDALKRRAQAPSVILAGYSGGAALAALLAARRADAAGLITVAGVLDHRAWTRADEVGDLAYSLNPADEADKLAGVPQIHYSGGKDRTVPVAQARSYAARFPAGRRPAIQVIAGYDHECCWPERWSGMAARPLPLPGEP
jgi:hypothetical protein